MAPTDGATKNVFQPMQVCRWKSSANLWVCSWKVLSLKSVRHVLTDHQYLQANISIELWVDMLRAIISMQAGTMHDQEIFFDIFISFLFGLWYIEAEAPWKHETWKTNQKHSMSICQRQENSKSNTSLQKGMQARGGCTCNSMKLAELRQVSVLLTPETSKRKQ